jgi:hypothetical protein
MNPELLKALLKAAVPLLKIAAPYVIAGGGLLLTGRPFLQSAWGMFGRLLEDQLAQLAAGGETAEAVLHMVAHDLAGGPGAVVTAEAVLP